MPEAARVLVIEADDSLSRELTAALESAGFKAQAANSVAKATALLSSLHFDIIVSEFHLPDGNIGKIYQDAVPFLGSTPVIFTAPSGHIDQVVGLVRTGPADYVQKPYDISALIARLRQLMRERHSFQKRSGWPDPIMISPVMRDLGKRLERLAASAVSALIVGELGCCKEIVARYTHRLSPRANEPFIAVRCGGLGGHDGEKLLFGEVLRFPASGEEVRTGCLEHAGRGTLFLDEISELPPALQGALIQVIDRRQFTRIGDLATHIPFEARILAASHFSAAKLRDRLSPDLVSRIAVIEVTVPPLRERQADIEPLVQTLLPEVASELGVSVLPVEAETIAAMHVHDWPGNVRELRNRLVRALAFADGSKIGVSDIFPVEVAEGASSIEPTLNSARAEAERQRIVEALASQRGRVGRAAQSLGISRVTLWTKMKRLGLSSHGVSADKETP